MNTVEKLYWIYEFKTKNPKNKIWLGFKLDDRMQINKMFKSLEWIWNNDFDQVHARGSKDAQSTFFEYYEMEHATLIKNMYEALNWRPESGTTDDL